MKNWIPKRQSNLSESLGSFFPQDCNITFGRYTSNPDDKLYHSKTKLLCCTAETNIMLCQLHLSLKNCIIGLKLLISKYFIWDPVLLFSHLQISFSFRDFSWIFCIYSLNGWPWQNCDAKQICILYPSLLPTYNVCLSNGVLQVTLTFLI